MPGRRTPPIPDRLAPQWAIRVTFDVLYFPAVPFSGLGGFRRFFFVKFDVSLWFSPIEGILDTLLVFYYVHIVGSMGSIGMFFKTQLIIIT